MLDRYLFRRVLLSSLGAVGVFAFILLLSNVVKDLLRAVAAKQIDLETFARLVLVLIPYVVSYALPMGILTGILLVLGRLSADGEINAMRAAGRSLPRIAAPVLAVAVLGAAVAAVFDNEIGPRSMAMYRQTLADAVRTSPLSFIIPREFVYSFPGYVIYVAEKEGTSLHGVWIWELDKQGRTTKVAHGMRGECRFNEAAAALDFRLERPLVEVRPAKDPEGAPSEGNYAPIGDSGGVGFSLPLDSLLGRKTYRRNLTLLTFRELLAERRRVLANADGKPAEEVFNTTIKIQYAMQEHFVLAVAVFSFAIVGIPLGIKIQRKESGVNLGLALVLALVFYFLLIMVDWLQKQPELRPDLLLWIPNILFATLGAWLLGRVDRM